MELPKFAVLERMARENPEALEELRQAHVEAIISQSGESNRRRLRGLQFKIDAIRQISSNPMSGCIRISKLMHDSLMELNTVLQSDAAVKARRFLMNTERSVTGAIEDSRAPDAAADADVPAATSSTSCRVFQMDRFRQARG